ncbi:hypothetical protein [Paenibacillus puerhi]|uniref:hypothetical protein n=1 Tax=Paenibacillus puerhi TaxID=2692622 RepID=UPI00135C7910|nr:hypothetical protein [Paenibacillus puerhi]
MRKRDFLFLAGCLVLAGLAAMLAPGRAKACSCAALPGTQEQLERKTAVYTAWSSASCGYERFAVGESYLIFASRDPDRLETGICEGTKPLSQA